MFKHKLGNIAIDHVVSNEAVILRINIVQDNGEIHTHDVRTTKTILLAIIKRLQGQLNEEQE